MKSQTLSNNIGYLISAMIGLGSGYAAAVERPVDIDPSPHQSSPVEPAPHLRRPAAPLASVKPPIQELPASVAAASEGFATRSAFVAAPAGVSAAAAGSTLSAPITISYSGGSPVLLVQDSGTNKGIQSLISNSSNATSALFGQTNGSGAGLTGYNSGTTGPAGKFGITNSNSDQPGVFTTTNGLGPALIGTITKPNSLQTAILGQNTVTTGAGTGVQGIGGAYGVSGFSADGIGVTGNGPTYGVIGESSNGSGVYGQSENGPGLFAISTSGYGADVFSSYNPALHAASYASYAILAETNNSRAIEARSQSQVAIYGESHGNAGVWGQGNGTYGLVGEDSEGGVGVYGSSNYGYAGYFAGTVGATSYETTSDRNAKTQIHAVDGGDILAKLIDLPVNAWVFKNAPQKKHVGPMAQDFHAVFGLDGDDDRHINLTDISGVSLVAIQELGREMRRKDARIAALELELESIRQLAARVTILEQSDGRTTAARSVAIKKKKDPLNGAI